MGRNSERRPSYRPTMLRMQASLSKVTLRSNGPSPITQREREGEVAGLPEGPLHLTRSQRLRSYGTQLAEEVALADLESSDDDIVGLCPQPYAPRHGKRHALHRLLMALFYIVFSKGFMHGLT